jgi:type I restriction enzyme, S subunit
MERANKNGWTQVFFGDVVERVHETGVPTSDESRIYIGLEHLDSESLTVTKWGSDVALIVPKTRVKKGDVLFARRNTHLRRCAASPFDTYFSPDGYAFRSKSEALLQDLLLYVVASDDFMTFAIEHSAGTHSKRVKWGDLMRYEFALPPLEEQRRIAGALGAMEEARARLTHVEGTIQGLRISHLNDFFEPRFRDGVPLTTVARIVAGGTPPKRDATLWGGGRPWASGKDLKIRHLRSTDATLTEEGWALATVVPQGATLIVVRGMILAHTFPVVRCEQDTAINQDLRALVAGDRLDPDYLLLWTEWAARWFLRRTAASSHGTKRIEGHVFGQALVPILSREAQAHIVTEHAALMDAEAAFKQRSADHKEVSKSFVLTVLGDPQ